MVKKKKNPVNNKELMAEIVKSKARLLERPEIKSEAMTPRLVELCQLMVERYAMSANWSGYSWIDESKNDALFALCNKWYKFDETKYTNPFAYYTTIMYRSFLGTHAKERKIQDVRDNIIESRGGTPSFRRQMDNEDKLIEERKSYDEMSDYEGYEDTKGDDESDIDNSKE